MLLAPAANALNDDHQRHEHSQITEVAINRTWSDKRLGIARIASRLCSGGSVAAFVIGVDQNGLEQNSLPCRGPAAAADRR